MDEPRPELKADEDAASPTFDELMPPDELVRSGRTRDDFFDAVLGLERPATIDEVADCANHGRDAAREYLEWFERVTSSPAVNAVASKTPRADGEAVIGEASTQWEASRSGEVSAPLRERHLRGLRAPLAAGCGTVTSAPIL